MPTQIHILPDDLANKIAAGEVVERPAAVVKELLENAIDAGADRIVIDVAAGGRETIRVSDNGSGMGRDDVLLALERHATSKIHTLSDLNAISTLGFRGEALPSIASVSRMTLESRTEGEEAGTRVSVEGGRVKEVSAVGRDVGTTVTVHGLFYNVPARRKFLKGIETEMRHIVACVSQIGLAYPALSIALSHNGRSILRLGQADCKRRIEEVFGLDAGREAVEMEVEEEGIRVHGFLGRPTFVRRSGASQALLVNGRPIQSRTLAHAIYDGYGGLIAKGDFPFYVLYLDIPPGEVDVNVHPTKREVRFADERRVYQVISGTVRRALREADVIPEVSPEVFEREARAETAVAPASFSERPAASVSTARETTRPYDGGRKVRPAALDLDLQMSLPLIERKPPEPKDASEEGTAEGDETETAAVWQLHETYILAEIKNGLILIDQHVAHERVLYEETLRGFLAQPTPGQQLLFPLTVSLSLTEMAFLREVFPLLERLGFGIRDLGGNSAFVDAIPSGLRQWEDGKLLKEIVEDLQEAGRSKSGVEERVATSYACHTAIRAGERLSKREMKALIDRLFATEDPFVCPHGRPIVIKMSLDEINKRFGR
ncbi:MAG: DNA mismatch repair endonuclease MutL [Candidatus Latescibacteria bacterium]|nr:DNA mismatch repair endonuclease MutL [Candidatus Latescibacterota bacterium]